MVVNQTVIAKKLKLSQRTVSLCLAGSELVAEATKKRVLEAAEEMGYRPNRSALAMRSGRFNAIGLLQSTNEQYSYLPAGIFIGMQEELTRQKMHLVVSSLPDEKLNDERVLPNVLRESLVDGLIVNYAYGFSPRFAEVIEHSRLPSIWLNTKRPYGCVIPDDVEAGRRLAERLLSLGHKRIDYFCHRTFDEHFSVADRFSGYESAMRAAGLTARKHVLEGNVNWSDIDAGLAFVRHILSAKDRPTAVIAYEMFEAMRTLLVAKEMNLEVPRDLSIATFSEREAASSGFPFTVLQIPTAQIGQRAAELLVKRVNDRKAVPPQETIPFGPEVGASVAPPVKGR
jgi:LacI family transcriptional regulator